MLGSGPGVAGTAMKIGRARGMRIAFCREQLGNDFAEGPFDFHLLAKPDVIHVTAGGIVRAAFDAQPVRELVRPMIGELARCQERSTSASNFCESWSARYANSIGRGQPASEVSVMRLRAVSPAGGGSHKAAWVALIVVNQLFPPSARVEPAG
jgi:hypothetical protein